MSSRLVRSLLPLFFPVNAPASAQERKKSPANKCDTFWSASIVTARERACANGHLGGVVWLTGLSGSGKSTIARELERKLFLLGKRAYVLDGDNIRSGLNSDLGFSPEDRKENIRRIGEVARLFADAGLICVVAFISPYRTDRDTARRLLPEGRFIEVYVNAPLEVCEQRDPKGLYAKARANVLREFTGISSPYEPPRSPELALRTDLLTVGESVAQVLKRLRSFNCRLRRDYPPQAGAFCNSRCTRNTTLSQREPPARRSPPAAGVYPLSKHQ